MTAPRVILRVFVPFTAAFFLSYLFRSINALIVSDLTTEVGLDAADLGLLTSVYFLSFAVLQIPVGVWLDRHGPRRVEAALLLVAAAGALLFAVSTGLVLLTVSRALIGIGVAAAFAAGIKANAQWFAADRTATMNGLLFMLGALGAFGATSPARLVLESSGGWRGLFVILAAATAVCALAIWGAVPEAQPRPGGAAATAPAGNPVSLRTILGDRRFVAVAPLSAACAGTAWALQGLWAAPWLADVDGLAQADVTRYLLVMAVAVCVAAVVFGSGADRLRRRGVSTAVPLGVVAAAVITAQLALLLGCPVSLMWWPVIAAAGSVPVLSFAYLAEFVAGETSGRANGVLNLFHFGGAFAVQYLIGVILALWPAEHGHYPPAAWQTAFAVNVALQAAALWYFVWARAGRGVVAAALRALLSAGAPLVAGAAAVIAPAGRPLRRRPVTRNAVCEAALRQAAVWRFAGLGGLSVAASLILTCAIAAVSANAVPAAAAMPARDRLAAVPPAVHGASDAEIAYALATFVGEVRSVSPDAAVERANWTDALSRLTRRGARMLAPDVPDATPSDGMRRRSVTVEVTAVARTAAETFEVRWRETILEDGAPPRQQRLRGVIAVVFDRAAAPTFRNPLGLAVDAVAWWPDGSGDGD